MTKVTLKEQMTWDEYSDIVCKIPEIIDCNKEYDAIITPIYGGIYIADAIRRYTNKRIVFTKIHSDDEVEYMLLKDAFNFQKIIIADDILDSGKTIETLINDFRYKRNGNIDIDVFVIYYVKETLEKMKNKYNEVNFYAMKERQSSWIVYPWEIDFD